MTDPISGQMASQAVESMASGEVQGGDEATGAGDFKEIMNADGGEDVGGLEGIDPVAEVQAPDAIEEVDEIPTDDFIQSILSEEADLHEMMERCMNGAKMGNDEMLQMQALIYSYSQRVELTTKVVEKATSGVQQVLNTQV